MSEEITTRAAVADAISADLKALDTAEYTPPAPEAPAAAEAKAPTTQTETPAPAADAVPQVAKALADTDLVIDPADGQARAWGEIRAERLRQADYTRKTMAVAEERRQIEALKAEFALQQEQARLKAQEMALPELPEDDPYAQRIRALQAQQDSIAQYTQTMQAQLQAQVAAREAEASRMALAAEEQRLVAAHGLSSRELDLVEREYYQRASAGEQITLDSVALEHKAFIAAVKEAAVKEYKDKHRVATPAATVSTPGVAGEEEQLVPGSRGLRERIRAEMASMIGG